MAAGNRAMSAKRILIVDDEAAVRDVVAFNLRRHGFHVDPAGDAEAARRMIADRRPDLAIIDWMLPVTAGLELTRSLRASASTQHLAVIMLTARTEECDKVAALDAGVDDYVTKPFGARELLARVQAVLRRTDRNGADAVVRANGLTLDAAGQRVTADEQSVELGPMEFKLLAFLMAHAERAHSREQLVDRVWGAPAKVEARSVDVQVSRLRKLLQPFNCDQYIQTVHGAGYRFSVRER
jgi:two-component system phosphate regulon response regulator PhoB